MSEEVCPKEFQIVTFIRHHLHMIRKGGLPVLGQKVINLLKKSYKIPLYILAIPIVLIVRLISPIICIRFGPLISSRIGHFAANMEVYLCERDAGLHGKRVLDIFYHTKPISNFQLKKMWDRIAPAFGYAKYLDIVNRHIPGESKFIIPLRLHQDRDYYCLLHKTKAHLKFTEEEEILGVRGLRKLGIEDGQPFVCFHNRDPHYLKKLYPDQNFDYHNYRDSKIQNYIPAAQELIRRGYCAIRMGALVGDKLSEISHEIIDYAVVGRTDFLDIYLSSKCRFFISSPNGLAYVPMVFRRPVAWVNFIPFAYVHAWDKDSLFIPKKLWLKSEKRFLTYPEILDSEIGRYFQTEQYQKAGIEVIENTADEIKDLALELDERLKGVWNQQKEDEELQKRFWALFKPTELNQHFITRIGTKFLRENLNLFQ